MATWFTHPAVPLAIGVGLGSRIVPWRMLLAGVALSLLPDLDILLWKAGISWYSIYGHRGFTHSLGFALLAALLFAWMFRQRSLTAFAFGFMVVATHALLDAWTWGGRGVALWWPFDDARFLFDHRPLPASPLGWQTFLRWGPHIVLTEIRWVWLPLTGMVAFCLAARIWFWPRIRHVTGIR